MALRVVKLAIRRLLLKGASHARILVVALSVPSLLATVIIPVSSVSAAGFVKGDLVVVTDGAGLKVRESAAGDFVAAEPYGTTGTVLDGPQSATLGGTDYTWWRIRYQDGVEGWSAEGYPGGVAYLQKQNVSPSAKFNVGDSVNVCNTGASGLAVRTDPPELAHMRKVYDGDTGTIMDGPFYGVPKGSSGCYSFWRVDYGGGNIGWSAEDYLCLRNELPSCSVSAEPRSGRAPLEVTFTLTAVDPEGSIAAWVLDVNGDGVADYDGLGSPPTTVTHRYTVASPLDGYSVVFIVTDPDGATDIATETVVVGENTPPQCTLSPDQTSGRVPFGVTFTLTASDPDGSISSWELAPGDESASYAGKGAPPSTESHTYVTAGTYTAILLVTDDEGATTARAVTIVAEPGSPEDVTLTLYVHEGSQFGPVLPGVRVTGHDGGGLIFDETTNESGYVVVTGVAGTWRFTAWASAPDYVDTTWTYTIIETCTRSLGHQSGE